MKRPLFQSLWPHEGRIAPKVDASLEHALDPRQVEALKRIGTRLRIPAEVIIRAALWLLLSYVASAPDLIERAFVKAVDFPHNRGTPAGKDEDKNE
jgi:uncharacterized protein YbaP (TraB family)